MLRELFAPPGPGQVVLEQHWHSGHVGSTDQRLHPIGIRLVGADAGLGADDEPFDGAKEIGSAHVFVERLKRDEPHGRPHGPQCGEGGRQPGVNVHRAADPGVRRPGVELGQALRVLGQKLVGMLRCFGAGRQHGLNPLAGNPGAEQVSHRADENAAWLALAGRFGQSFGMEGWGEVSPQPMGETPGVAVGAAVQTTSDRIPRSVSPVDAAFALQVHLLSPLRLLARFVPVGRVALRAADGGFHLARNPLVTTAQAFVVRQFHLGPQVALGIAEHLVTRLLAERVQIDCRQPAVVVVAVDLAQAREPHNVVAASGLAHFVEPLHNCLPQPGGILGTSLAAPGLARENAVAPIVALRIDGCGCHCLSPLLLMIELYRYTSTLVNRVWGEFALARQTFTYPEPGVIV